MKTVDLLTEAGKKRIPLVGQIEITRFCNFKCKHCYLPDKNRKHMSFAEFQKYADEMKLAGTRFLTITGGEPLTNPDFLNIYEYAAHKGFVISVFSNGALLNDSHFALFTKIPPQYIEISLYGASDATYKMFAGVTNQFEKVVSNIHKLLDLGIRVRLKTFVTKLNYHDFDAIRQRVHELLGSAPASFKYDYSLLPRLDGTSDNQQYRISAEDVVKLNISEGNDCMEKWNLKMNDKRYWKNSSSQCGCGRHSYSIDVFGNVQTCTFNTYTRANLAHRSFADIWDEFGRRINNSSANVSNNRCTICEYSFLCDNCPAVGYAEQGIEYGNTAVSFLCEVARLRYIALLEYNRNSETR